MKQISDMVVLHFAHLEGRPFAGVDVAVPQHIKAQQAYAKIGFVNITNIQVEGVYNQFSYDKAFDIQRLPEPFCHPDIIVFHEIYRPAFLALCKWAIALNIPYIVIPHGGLTTMAQKQKRLKKLVGNTLLFNKYIKNAAAIQCLSVREMNESVIVQNKFIGSNGVSKTMPKGGFSDGAINLLYIGRLDIQVKGLDLLLQAICNCKDLLLEKRCSLHIYGPEEDEEYPQLVELVRKHGLENIVSLHGQIVGEEKIKAICSADCYIQTSRTEGMPMGVLEAQAMGLPCIVSEGTGMGEIVRQYDSGWTCPTTAEGIEAAIRTAVGEQEKFLEKSNHAVKMIEENFEWGYVARTTLETYKNYMK